MRPEQESFFEALYKENFPLLWRKAAAVLHNSDLAAEVVQDLFHDTVKKIDEVMEQPEPQLWLRRQLIYKLCTPSVVLPGPPSLRLVGCGRLAAGPRARRRRCPGTERR